MTPAPAAGIVLTRAAGDSGDNGEHGDDAEARALRERGLTVHLFPLIRIVPPADPAAARAALAALAGFDLAVPVSPAAARATLELLDGPWPASCAVGCVGPGSRAAFERARRPQAADAPAPRVFSAPAGQSDSEGLWQALQPLRPQGWGGARALILRGGPGRDWLADTLRAAGAQVQVVDVYRRVPPPAEADTLHRLRALLDAAPVWWLGAAEGVRNLGQLLRACGLEPAAALAPQRALAPHPRIVEAARVAGFGRAELCARDPDAVVAAVRAAGRRDPHGH